MFHFSLPNKLMLCPGHIKYLCSLPIFINILKYFNATRLPLFYTDKFNQYFAHLSCFKTLNGNFLQFFATYYNNLRFLNIFFASKSFFDRILQSGNLFTSLHWIDPKIFVDRAVSTFSP